MRHYTLALLVSLGTSGCALMHDGGSGSGAAPALRYDNCDSGCGLDQNGVAAGGARTAIVVDGAIRYASVRSSNPAVAAFTDAGNNKIAVDSGTPGSATLELVDGSGRVVVSGVVTVVPTAQLRASQGWQGPAPTIVEGVPLTFHVTTLDGNGKITKGDGSVSFALDGTLKAAVAPIDGDAIAFAGSAGSGSIVASCPNASLSQPITVVPTSAVTDLGMTAQLEPGDQAVVTVVPHTAGGAVYAAGCAWTVSDPSVTLQDDVTPRLDLGPGEVAIFNVNRPGSYSIGCTVAGQTSSVTVTR